MAIENEPEFDAPPSDEAAFDKEGEERTSDEIECPDWLWELEQQSRWEGHVRAAVPPAPAPPPARAAARCPWLKEATPSETPSIGNHYSPSKLLISHIQITASL